ncbi:MAG: type II toxin-antitoxin system ParD family antitoxin [Pseudomonadota bacterium]
MATRNVVLTPDQDALVSDLVASGRYQNASEAMRAGLRLLEAEEARIEGIRRGLREGLTQARAGDLAIGDGAAAVRRAFQTAEARANN